MYKKNKLWGIVLSICILISICNTYAYAAGSGKVTLSSTSGTEGATVTVSGSISTTTNMAAAHVVMSYDQSGLKYVSGSSGVTGGSGSVQLFADTVNNPVKSLSFSMKFQILKPGSFKVNVENADVTDDGDMNSMSITRGSATVTGKAATTKPSTGNGGGTTTPNNPTSPQPNKNGNNKLNSLQVYPGTLSPAFSADVTDYTVTVPGDTTEVTITATAQSSKATVNVSGGKELKLGPNEASVSVIAENGSATSYKITIMCGEIEKIQVGGVEHTINENFTDEQIPNGFSRTKVAYKEREYEALTNAKGNLVLVSLQTGEIADYYIYDKTTQEFYPFIQIVLSEGKYIIPLQLKKDIKEFGNLEMFTFPFRDKAIDAWLLDEEFSIICAMNQEGEELLYRYDVVDGTFQRYKDIEIEPVETEEKTLFPNEYYMYAIAGLGALSLILFIAMIYFIASRKARHEGRKKKAIKKMEKQKAKEEKERAKKEAELERIREAERIEEEKRRAKEEKIAEKERAKEEKRMAREQKKNKEM